MSSPECHDSDRVVSHRTNILMHLQNGYREKRLQHQRERNNIALRGGALLMALIIAVCWVHEPPAGTWIRMPLGPWMLIQLIFAIIYGYYLYYSMRVYEFDRRGDLVEAKLYAEYGKIVPPQDYRSLMHCKGCDSTWVRWLRRIPGWTLVILYLIIGVTAVW